MPVLDFPSNYVDDNAAKTLPPVALAILTGASGERISEIAANYLAGRDFLYTLAIMCSPGNEIDAERVMDAMSLEELYHAIGITSELDVSGDVDAPLALEIADREDARLLLKKLIESDKVGHVASGFMLRWIVSRWQDNCQKGEASLAKAASVIEEWGKRNGVAGTGKQNVARNIWTKYSSVSHLWAALHLMQEGNREPFTPSGFILFCSTAQWLLEQGAAIVPKGRRTGESVLSLDRAWAVPASFVQRTRTGSIVYLWNPVPGAHDIREMKWGFPE